MKVLTVKEYMIADLYGKTSKDKMKHKPPMCSYAHYFTVAMLEHLKELDAISTLYYTNSLQRHSFVKFLPFITAKVDAAHTWKQALHIFKIHSNHIFTVLPGLCSPNKGVWSRPEVLTDQLGLFIAQYLITEPIHYVYLVEQAYAYSNNDPWLPDFKFEPNEGPNQISLDYLEKAKTIEPLLDSMRYDYFFKQEDI